MRRGDKNNDDHNDENIIAVKATVCYRPEVIRVRIRIRLRVSIIVLRISLLCFLSDCVDVMHIYRCRYRYSCSCREGFSTYLLLLLPHQHLDSTPQVPADRKSFF